MKIDNEMKLEIMSCSINESFGRSVVAAFAAQLDPTIEELSEIKTAVSEAITNATVHAYENKIGIIYIFAKISGDKLKIEIEDKGQGIEDIEQAMQPLYTSKPDLERSGMGFLVMQTFMDEIKVESKVGEGTKVIMTKTIGTC